VTNQSNATNRPLLWDDDPPAELRPGRRREADGRPRPSAAGRRNSPGMPLQFDEEGDDAPRLGAERFRASRASWWRPSSKAGRFFLSLAALAAIGGCVATCIVAAHFLEHDARFRIAGSSNIQATGLTEVSRGDLLPIFGEDIGRNVFFVPLQERRHQLEQIPWVEHATVMRVLPSQIRVSIVERQPVAFTRHGQQIGLVDASGVLLSMSPKTMAKRHYSFPVVTGMDPGDSAESRKERMAVYLRLMTELDAGGQHNSEQISEIDLTDPEDARVLMPEPGADILAHFGEDHFLERYGRYKAHIAEWRQQYPHLKSVDLRYDNQVVLEMTSGAETADTSAQGNGGTLSSAQSAGATAPSKTTAKPSAKKNKRPQTAKHAAPRRAAANAGRRAPVANAGAVSTGGEGE
jgi:cell division protein FtsQ